MTKAMPFLQKAILLSYDPRRFGAGLFCAHLQLAAYTSSMMAISAASPRRTPVFTMRV